MNKKLYIVPLVLSIVTLASCSTSKLQGFEKFIDNIKKSEQSINKYTEVAEIKDGDMITYSKVTDYGITRGEKLRTDVSITTLRLSDDGAGLMPSTESYWTIGDKRFEMINNEVFETSFEKPSYFLTFVPNESYFQEGYTLTDEDSKMSVKGQIKDSEITYFFGNKSFTGVTNLNVEINLENDLLKSFDATYKTKNNKDASIHTKYLYPANDKPGEIDYVEATFHLEGGEAKGIKDKVMYKYDFKGGYETLIIDPLLLVPDSIKKTGYHIEGWYRTKTVNGDEVTYSDKWDFTKDKMDRNGVELYAKWDKDVHHSYNVIYRDEETGEEFLVNSYKAEKGSYFNDLLNSQNSPVLKDRTLMGFMDEFGNPWNNNFTHPGGETDTVVKVYVDTIPGRYQIINTAQDFEKIKPNMNVYLANDIDLNGKAISFKEFSATEFLGNGHKISNGKIKYNATKSGLDKDLFSDDTIKSNLYISLFKDIKPNVEVKTDNAGTYEVVTYSVIKDVTFERFTVDVKAPLDLIKTIIVAPLAVRANGTALENVAFSGEFTISRTPKNVKLEVITDRLIYNSIAGTEANCKVNIKLIDNRK